MHRWPVGIRSTEQVIDYLMANAAGAPRDLSYFRQTGSTVDRRYIAGQCNATALTTMTTTADTYYAMPFVAPRGGTLDRLGVEITTGVAKVTGQIGIYSNTSHTNLLPATLLASISTFSTSTGVQSGTISLALAPGEWYWFAYADNGGSVVVRAVAVAGAWPIYGMASTFGTAAGIGWTVTSAFGSGLASTFPTSGSVFSTAIPAVGVRFSA